MAQHATPLLNSDRIRVLAADSTRMSSQLLAQALAQDGQFHVTGIDPQSTSILAAVADERPHVVLMSSVLEDSSSTGFDLIRQVCAAHPDTRVVLMMDTSKRSAVVEAFRCGAHGVFSRTESPKLLAKCICSVHQGQVWANSSELRFLLEALCESEPVRVVDAGGESMLSKREQDVVRCVAEGLSNREIAGRLGLTEHTVKNYLFRIFDKLGVSSRVEVVLYAFRFRKDLVRPQASENSCVQCSGTFATATPSRAAGAMPVAVKRSLEAAGKLARQVRC